MEDKNKFSSKHGLRLVRNDDNPDDFDIFNEGQERIDHDIYIIKECKSEKNNNVPSATSSFTGSPASKIPFLIKQNIDCEHSYACKVGGASKPYPRDSSGYERIDDDIYIIKECKPENNNVPSATSSFIGSPTTNATISDGDQFDEKPKTLYDGLQFKKKKENDDGKMAEKLEKKNEDCEFKKAVKKKKSEYAKELKMKEKLEKKKEDCEFKKAVKKKKSEYAKELKMKEKDRGDGMAKKDDWLQHKHTVTPDENYGSKPENISLSALLNTSNEFQEIENPIGEMEMLINQPKTKVLKKKKTEEKKKNDRRLPCSTKKIEEKTLQKIDVPQYKNIENEILTPSKEEDGDDEDISDHNLLKRHKASEEKERASWNCFLANLKKNQKKGFKEVNSPSNPVKDVSQDRTLQDDVPQGPNFHLDQNPGPSSSTRVSDHNQASTGDQRDH